MDTSVIDRTGQYSDVQQTGKDATTQPNMANAKAPLTDIARAILVLRGHRVLLDSDLSALYGVATKALLQAVKRNSERFPADFMIRLSVKEWVALRSQNVTSKPARGGRRYPPYAFIEQGVAMLSSVLASRRAIAVNIQIIPFSRLSANS